MSEQLLLGDDGELVTKAELDQAKAERTGPPALRLISLGAGVQSTAVLLLALDGELGHVDAALFADTGWEPAATYEHLAWLERLAGERLPIVRVSQGNLRADALDPAHRFASMPLYVANRDGSGGMLRRQCTSEYKLKPLREATRLLLGAKQEERACRGQEALASGDHAGCPRCQGTGVVQVIGRPPRGAYADSLIGISTDEAHRMRDDDVAYLRNVYPLVDLGMDRAACEAYLADRVPHPVAKSACIGCPFHGNRQWRELRDHSPAEWADAVAFDKAIRAGHASAAEPLLGEAYLHSQRRPLDQVDLRPPEVRRAEAERLALEAGGQLTLLDDDEADTFGNECSGVCGV